MSSSWKKVPFLDAVKDLSSGNEKVPQAEYLKSGKYPVVDQGKDLIAGYVNDDKLLWKGPLPVVVFGDHTRQIKHIDFPFCMGADGIKVLSPKSVNTRYLYHYLRSLRIESAGYSRHFKFLKEFEVAFPVDNLEQKRIAAILDQAECLCAKRRTVLEKLDDLAQAIFIEMFGEPHSNSLGWSDTEKLGDVAELVSGVAKGRALKSASTRVVPYLAVANVQDRRLALTNVKEIEASEEEIARYRLRVGDLLLTEGGDPDKLGRGSLWNGEIEDCIHQNHVFRVRLQVEHIRPLFLNWLVGSQRGKRYFLKSAKQTTGIASINMGQLKQFPLLTPPLDLQLEFEQRLERLKLNVEMQSKSLAELDALFASLQHRAFRGEL